MVESGFDAIPISRRVEAWRMNGEGWAIDESVWEVETGQLVAARRFLDLMSLWWDDIWGG